ncbi:putative sulfate exporter family transporter [Marinilabiliaceae bacterium JC017]|nr:putative sulfate exporter family transporter [Marinilabiliaceae bacterium JC017]
MDRFKHLQQIKLLLLITLPVICFLPMISAPMALAAGLVTAFIPGNKPAFNTSKITSRLLQSSIVLMGFGINLSQAIQVGEKGLMLTVGSVLLTITAGITLGYFFKVNKRTAYLISCGTAICGGSAIAATAPVIHARNNEVSMALAIVFTLNAIALFIFPALGHFLHMSQDTFGYWAAIAIHDTSSVVGAGSAYGDHALQVATTVKLTRALWIIPVSLITSVFFREGDMKKIKIPWFIGLFVLAILAGHFIPQMEPVYHNLNWLGHRGMIVALFFIGTAITPGEIKKAGIKPVLMGVLLWILISVTSLVFII